jgi:hypothetical protein
MSSGRSRGTGTSEPAQGEPVRRRRFPDMIAQIGARATVLVTGGPFAARASVAQGARGLVLSRRNGEDGRDYFEVSILFGADRVAAPIHIAADDHDVVARWRRHADDLGLPLMMERADGVIVTAYAHVGRVAVSPACVRRRNATLTGRRSRFLLRRKPGVPRASTSAPAN